MKIYFVILFCVLNFNSIAQETYKKHKSPKKATLYSSIIPGLGQFYNKKYWKIPIIYAGIGTSLYFVNENQIKYNDYKNAISIRENPDGNPDKYQGVYNNSQLTTLMNYYKKNRDVSFIMVFTFYLLNIIDASVDAHLFDFNINEDLSIETTPIIKNNSLYQPGLSVQLNF